MVETKEAFRRADILHKETDLAIETSIALRDATARLLRPSEADRDLRDFYTHYRMYLSEIVQLAYRFRQTVRPDNQFMRHILDIHESFFDKKHLTTSDSSSFPYLTSFNNLWKQWENQPDTTVSNLLRRCLSVANIEHREEHLRTLMEWVNEGAEKCPDDILPPVDDFNLGRSKFVSEFSHKASWAAQSLHKAFTSANSCRCEQHHEFEARIFIRAYQEAHTSSTWEFDMFLAFEENWQEAHVKVPENDEDSTVHAKSNRVRFEPSALRSTRFQRRSEVRTQIKQLCTYVRKVSEKKSKCLEMDVDMDQLWKRASLDCRYRIEKQRPPISLRQFISKHYGSLTMKTKGILAVIISRAVLHFHGTPWIQRDWDSSKILFYHKPQNIHTKSYIPVKPYIHAHLYDVACCGQDFGSDNAPEFGLGDSEQNDLEEDIDPDDLIDHQCPILVALATILLELSLGKPYPILAQMCGLTVSGEEDSNSAWDSATRVFEHWKSIIPETSSFVKVVDSCLRPPLWEDDEGRKLDNQALRQRLHEKVVVPLETELTEGFSHIDIEKLDYEAEKMGLDCWGQQVLNNDQGIPEAKTKKDIPSSILGDWQADISNGMHRKRSQTVVLGHHSYNRTRVSGTKFLGGQFFDDTTPSEGYTITQCDAYESWRVKFRAVYEKFVTINFSSSSLFAPVKIAVLDTGTDTDHCSLQAYEDQIKARYNWTDIGPIDDITDQLGHGTHIAGLILQYCPHAELYIAKIVDKGPLDPGVMAKAINHAVMKWGVDIISISSGFPTREIPRYAELQTAIETANSAKTLIFAAASNGGANSDRAYPARHADVFCIHSTDAFGNGSQFNPTAKGNMSNFATIGEAVESCWPEYIDPNDENPASTRHRSGTSYATPIAASIAGFLLSYARLHMTKKQSEDLTRHATMRSVLHELAKSRGNYQYLTLSLHPDHLFGRNESSIKTTIEEAICQSP